MQKIAILTDTTSDVDPSIIKEYNIVEVPLQIIYNSEVTYKDKYEKNIDDVINDINSNTISSSLPLTSDLIEKIEYIISEGYTHIIATCMSCGISGTYNLFRQILNLYSDKITYHLIDCRSCSMGMGFLITNCQIKCNTYGKKPKSSSLGVLYCIHFLGLLFIKLKLSFKSLIFTSDKSIPLG